MTYGSGYIWDKIVRNVLKLQFPFILFHKYLSSFNIIRLSVSLLNFYVLKFLVVFCFDEKAFFVPVSPTLGLKRDTFFLSYGYSH